MTSPRVTVLLSVYNGERFLAEAIDSILCQSYKDYEFIIIDDASTDSTPEILKRYARKDSRIKIVTNPVNLRLAASLNKGISLASGELIARMDADDVSLPDRLEKQVDLIIDGGHGGLEASTVVSLTDGDPQVLRVGAGDPQPFEQGAD